MSKYISISKIECDSTIQQRAAGLDQATVDEYAEVLSQAEGNSWPFPPITVCRKQAEEGKRAKADWLHYVADGFHRIAAAKQAGLEQVKADILLGADPVKQATLYAVGANAEHGRPRTAEDKRRAVTTLLADKEWGEWADRELARRVKVSPNFVGKVRAEYVAEQSSVLEDTCDDKPKAKPIAVFDDADKITTCSAL